MTREAGVAPEQGGEHDLGGAHGHEPHQERDAGRDSPALERTLAVRREAEERPHLVVARVVPRAVHRGQAEAQAEHQGADRGGLGHRSSRGPERHSA